MRRRRAAGERSAAAKDSRDILCVIGCMKDEARHITEWIDHYFWQGAAHLVVIDNGSTDETARLVEEHPRRRDITLFRWPRPFHQIGHVRRAVTEARLLERFQWLVAADGDEFWFAKSGAPLSQVLSEFERIDLVYCNWTLFGSAADGAPPASLRTELTRCQPALGSHDFTKWAVRTDALSQPAMLSIHKVNGIESGRTVSDTHLLQLNHYFTQSRAYWRDVKMARGSAVDPAHSVLRTWEMFEDFERDCTAFDDRLARLVLASAGADLRTGEGTKPRRTG
ncbi:MAG TPA: glycosyltransferase family 2 protein [Tabrizicola sp.]|nr:glycosyltransferase family 2 protein [Tabrizicola sp.]